MFGYSWDSNKNTTEKIAKDVNGSKDRKETSRITVDSVTGHKQLNIRQFSPDMIKNKYFTATCIGGTRAGKSTLIKDLIKQKNLTHGLVICPTTECTGEYTETKSMKVSPDFTTEILDNFMTNLTKDYKNGQMREQVLVLDDCLHSKKNWVKNGKLQNLILSGRYLKCNTLLSQQYSTGMPPNLRTNIDYVFIFAENLGHQREKLYQYYAGVFPTFDKFQIVLNACTQNYGCLVIDNSSHSNKLEDLVFWYKASL